MNSAMHSHAMYEGLKGVVMILLEPEISDLLDQESPNSCPQNPPSPMAEGIDSLWPTTLHTRAIPIRRP